MFYKEYVFTGKHAQFVKNLVSNSDVQLFYRYLDVLALAPIIGFLYGRKGTVEKKEPTARILSDQIININDLLKHIYRLIMLLEDQKFNLDKKMEKAFKDIADEEAFEQNLNIFHAYVLGGIEFLHEKLFENKTDRWECLEGLNELVDEFYDDLEVRSSDEDIKEIIKKYE